MSDGTDHDMLIRIDERTAALVDAHNEMVEWMKKSDDRICSLEACQNRWIGRDGAIVAGLSITGAAIITFIFDLFNKVRP